MRFTLLYFTIILFSSIQHAQSTAIVFGPRAASGDTVLRKVTMQTWKPGRFGYRISDTIPTRSRANILVQNFSPSGQILSQTRREGPRRPGKMHTLKDSLTYQYNEQDSLIISIYRSYRTKGRFTADTTKYIRTLSNKVIEERHSSSFGNIDDVSWLTYSYDTLGRVLRSSEYMTSYGNPRVVRNISYEYNDQNRTQIFRDTGFSVTSLIPKWLHVDTTFFSEDSLSIYSIQHRRQLHVSEGQSSRPPSVKYSWTRLDSCDNCLSCIILDGTGDTLQNRRLEVIGASCNRPQSLVLHRKDKPIRREDFQYRVGPAKRLLEKRTKLNGKLNEVSWYAVEYW